MEESTVMIIGVTGGVGAGKSTVLAILKEEYRALVIEMDAVGKMLMEPDGPCFGPTAALFGNACVREDGTLGEPVWSPCVRGPRDFLVCGEYVLVAGQRDG